MVFSVVATRYHTKNNALRYKKLCVALFSMINRTDAHVLSLIYCRWCPVNDVLSFDVASLVSCNWCIVTDRQLLRQWHRKKSNFPDYSRSSRFCQL